MRVDPTPATRSNQKTPGVFKTFRALRHRDFRLLWVGLAVSAVGTWMQIVAQSLLVLKITHGSAFALGTVSLAQALAFFLFALIGGSVADRLDKRRLLLFTQTGSAALAILLGFLTLFGVVQLWMILVLAFLNGTLLSFDQPARGALIPVLVPKEDLGNAISLQAMIFNGASTLGPALAGFGVAALGYAGNFFLNGASFLAVLIALYLMRVPGGPTHQQSTFQAIRTALGTVRRDAVLPWILSGYAALLFLGPSSALILPVYAVKILHIGPELLGLLFSAAGVGTIVGALFLASSGQQSTKRTHLLEWHLHLGSCANRICPQRTVLDFDGGASGLRSWSDTCRNDDDYAIANARARADERTRDEP